MSKTVTLSEADVQALRMAHFTLKTGDATDDRAAADAFQRLLGGLGIERKAEPLASIEPPVNVAGHDNVADSGVPGLMGTWHAAPEIERAGRRGRPRKRAA